MRFVALLVFLAGLAVVRAAEPQREIAAEYGERVRYDGVRLKYSDFTVRFAKKEEHRLAGTRLVGITFTFDVLGAAKEKISEFGFTASGLTDTTCVFAVGEKTFIAEMFYTTAGQPVRPETPPKQNGELSDGEIIIWDAATARSGNLQLIERFERANQTPEPTPTAVTPRADARVAPSAVVAHL